MAETVEMTLFELALAAQVGIRRRLNSMRRQTIIVGNPNERFRWHTDIEAAIAEMAYAKFSGQYWDGSVNTFMVPDVGQVYVRHTEHDGGCLVLRPGKDDPSKLYVLVTGKAPTYTIRGMIQGADGMVDAYLRGGEFPAWFVPQAALHSACRHV